MKHAFLNCNRIVPIHTRSATTSAIASDWASLAHGSGLVIEVVVTEGRAAAADDNTLTLQQATSNSGGGSKALVPRRAYRRSNATNLASAAAAALSEIDGGAMHVDGNLTTIYDVEIDASELDVENGFKYVSAHLAAVSGSTTHAWMMAIASDLRQKVAPGEQVNVLA